MDKMSNNDVQTSIQLAVEDLEENLYDVQNVVQLLAMSLTSNEEDEHMVRSINVINKMLANILKTDIVTIKQLLQHKE